MNIETFIFLFFYIIPIIILLYTAYRLFIDKRERYGGSYEVTVLILIAFVPGLNTILSFIIGGEFLIKKLMNKYHGN